MIMDHDLGASVYKTWSPAQRRDEIAKLVEGYRAGLPVGILCNMAEVIAGSRKQAKKHLMKMLSTEERNLAISGETGGMQLLVKEFLL
jgi:hypothetical protein